MTKRLVLFMCLFFVLMIGGARGAVVLDEQVDSYTTKFDLHVLEDKEGAYGIQDIFSADINRTFKPVSSNTIDYGFSESAYWLKFTVSNPYNHQFEWFLEVAYPMLDSVQLFFISDKGFESQSTGDLVPFNNRGNNYRNFLFPQRSLPHSHGDYYLRIQSTSSINIPLRIWSLQGIKDKIDVEQIVFGFYFGAMLIMIIYNFLLYLSLKQPTYLYYVIFMSVSVLFLFTLNGFSYKYLWPNSVWWANNCMPFLIFICNTFCVVFVRSFLETKKELPALDWWLKAYIFLNIVFLSVSLFIDYRVIIKIATLLALLAALLPLFTSLLLITRSRQARFYLLAWSFLLFGIIVYGLKSYGVLAHNIMTEFSMITGLIVEVILLSFGIADRINTITKENLAAQEREIIIQRKAFDEQKLLTSSFERFVPKRFLSLLGRKNINEVRLGDHVERKMSVLFSDIRQFTNMSENKSPGEVFTFVNNYLGDMGPIIKKHNGVIDKYIGDAIMAIFDDANDALKAGEAMLKGVDSFNAHRAKDGLPPISIGVGINTGDIMLGTVGARERMEGTVIGQTVNIASRVEALTKKYHTSLLISDDTYQELQNPSEFQLRVIDKVAVKGTTDPITIWEVFPETGRG